MTKQEIALWFQLFLIAAGIIGFIALVIHEMRQEPDSIAARKKKAQKKQYKKELKEIKEDALKFGIPANILKPLKRHFDVELLIESYMLGQKPDEIAECIKHCTFESEEALGDVYFELIKMFRLGLNREVVLNATGIDIYNLDKYLIKDPEKKAYFLIDLLIKKTANAGGKKYTESEVMDELRDIYTRNDYTAGCFNVVPSTPRGAHNNCSRPNTSISFLKKTYPELLEHPFFKDVAIDDKTISTQLTYIIQEFGVNNQIINTIMSEIQKLKKEKGESRIESDLKKINWDYRKTVSKAEAKMLETMRHGFELGIDLTEEWKKYSYLAHPVINDNYWHDGLQETALSNALMFEKHFEEEKKKLYTVKEKESIIDTSHLKIKDPTKKFILVEED